MARSSKIKASIKTTDNKGSKVSSGLSSGSSPSPLMKLAGKDYTKKKKQKPSGADQFGTPGFGLTGMTGED